MTEALQTSIAAAEAELKTCPEEDKVHVERRLARLHAKQADRAADPKKHAERMARRESQSKKRAEQQSAELDAARAVAARAKALCESAGEIASDDQRSWQKLAESVSEEFDTLDKREALSLALSLDGSRIARLVSRLAVREGLNRERLRASALRKLSAEERELVQTIGLGAPAALTSKVSKPEAKIDG